MRVIVQRWAVMAVIFVCVLALAQAEAESCTANTEISPVTRNALDSSAQQFFRYAEQGNAAALQQNAAFDVANIVTANKDLFAGQATTKFVYLLDNSQGGQSAEFFCGVYPNLVGFRFGSLPAGQYAVVVQDVTGGKVPVRVSWILQKSGNAWKIAGLYPKAQQVAGHDYAWFVTKAREYKSAGQNHDAWFYYMMANELMRPFPAVTNNTLDQLYDEMEKVRPPDLPGERPMPLSVQVCMPSAAGAPNCTNKNFSVTEMFPIVSTDNRLQLVVKYQEPDISDTSKTFQENMAVIKGLVTRYPELRQAFDGVVARAVAPNGQDYGSLLAMKDVK